MKTISASYLNERLVKENLSIFLYEYDKKNGFYNMKGSIYSLNSNSDIIIKFVKDSYNKVMIFKAHTIISIMYDITHIEINNERYEVNYDYIK